MLEILKTKSAIAAGVVGIISLLLTATSFLSRSDPAPIVQIEDGQLQGRISLSRSGFDFFEYLGIPYGQPPVNDLRYEAPVPVRPWKGVKKVTSYPPPCIQLDASIRGRIVGVEDCLFLNVFTRDVAPKKKKPVMVYIYGGGFLSGASGIYRPNFFMDEDIVLVTFNYRLGPLGFLNTGSDGLIRGNMGLKDQNLVLKWVKKNIDKFGGDPEHITIFGESAGAASVHYHIVSPASKGLFHKAIAQSGAITCPWSFTSKPEEVTQMFIKEIRCPTGNKAKMVECLKRANAEDLVKVQIKQMNPTNEMLLFVPSAETVIRPDTFLTEDPHNILEAGNFTKMPLLLGVTSGEGGLRTARFDAMPELIPVIDERWTELAPKLLCDKKGTMFHKKEVSDKVRDYYFGKSDFTSDLQSFKRNFTKLMSDRLFFEPIHRAAKIHTKQRAPTYLYFYNYDSVKLPSIYSLFRAVRPDDWLLAEFKMASSIIVDWVKENILGGEGPHEFGVTHADDLFQLWNMEGITGIASGKDADFSKNFVKAFVDFAKDESSLKFSGVEWPPNKLQREGSKGSLTSQPLQYMLLDKEPRVIDEPFADRMEFWESLWIQDSRR